MSDFTGPIGPTKREFDDWYWRLRNICVPLMAQGHGLVVHPTNEAPLRDFLERLAEDPNWNFDTTPPLFTSRFCRKDRIQPVDPETQKEMVMSQVVNSKTGFGRFSGLLTPPGRGEPLHNPWKEAKAKGGRGKGPRDTTGR